MIPPSMNSTAPTYLTPAQEAAARVRFAPGVRVKRRRGHWLGTVIERPADADPRVHESALWVLPDADQPDGAYPMPSRPASYAPSAMVDGFHIIAAGKATP